MPRPKSIGDTVFAGSINADGVIRVRVEKTAADNTIARVIQLVEQAQASKAPTTRFSDLEELHEFQGRKRKEFEDYVRRNRLNVNNWLRYAEWEGVC